MATVRSNSKINRWIAYGFITACLLVGVWHAAVYVVGKNNTQNYTGSQQQINPPPQGDVEGPGLPVRLIIPSINVDAKIIYVGLAPDGSVGVPAGPDEVAWFGLGPRPGASGS